VIASFEVMMTNCQIVESQHQLKIKTTALVIFSFEEIHLWEYVNLVLIHTKKFIHVPIFP